MKIKTKIHRGFLYLSVILFINCQSLAATMQEIGVAALIVNIVSGEIENKSEVLVGNDILFHDEIIRTSINSKAQLLFSDQTVLTIGQESDVVLDSFVYDVEKTDPKVAINVTKGLIRFVSGSLPKESYVIKTPTAVIGIRGTTLDVFVAKTGATEVVLRRGQAVVRARSRVGTPEKNIRKRPKSQTLATPNTSTVVLTGRRPPTKPTPEKPSLKTLFGGLNKLNPDQEGVFQAVDPNRQVVEDNFRIATEKEQKYIEEVSAPANGAEKLVPKKVNETAPEKIEPKPKSTPVQRDLKEPLKLATPDNKTDSTQKLVIEKKENTPKALSSAAKARTFTSDSVSSGGAFQKNFVDLSSTLDKTSKLEKTLQKRLANCQGKKCAALAAKKKVIAAGSRVLLTHGITLAKEAAEKGYNLEALAKSIAGSQIRLTSALYSGSSIGQKPTRQGEKGSKVALATVSQSVAPNAGSALTLKNKPVKGGLERPKTEKPKVEQPKTEKPKAIPKAKAKPKLSKKLDAPKVTQPKIAKPKIAQPKIAKPKIAQPRITKPKISKPKVALPKVFKPKIAKPKVKKPKVRKPIIAKPRVTKPIIKRPKLSFQKILQKARTKSKDVTKTTRTQSSAVLKTQ